jgi:CsoR family transcriptional regulator, copper-sensing transcriptional repressor
LTTTKKVVLLTQPHWGGLNMTDKENNIRRLKTIEGHIRGVQRMVNDDNYCIDVIRQINAIQSALNKISINILDSHLNSCLISAVRGDDSNERERVLKEIVDVFEAATKV